MMGTSPRQLSAMVAAVVTCAPLALLGAPVVAQVMAGVFGAAGMMAAAAADRRRAYEPSAHVDVQPTLGGLAQELRRLNAQPARPRRPAVLTPKDCAVSAIAPLGSQVYVAPGPLTSEAWPTITPTSSAGGRTDLVIVRVEDPNAPETGTWAEPADPVHGRYAFVRVIEGVPRGTWNVAQVNSAWNAITLARIDRPASTGCVRPAHITDLRTLTDLQAEAQPDARVSDLLIAEHKIEDGAFDTVEIRAWSIGRVVRRDKARMIDAKYPMLDRPADYAARGTPYIGHVQQGTGRSLPAFGGQFADVPKKKRRRPRL